jgi:spermidine synthase
MENAELFEKVPGCAQQRAGHTMLQFQEKSESDAVTTYGLTSVRVETRTTAGVDVLIGESPTYGRMLFLDGELQSASADEHIYHEALVHPALDGIIRGGDGNAVRVLVVGGGEGATVREVLKWSQVSHVTWVDYDAELVALCREHLRWAPGVYEDPRVQLITEDIREVLPTLGGYDAIILDLPDPDGDTGYLYSAAFWSDLNAHLNGGGRIVTHCGPVRPFGSIGAGLQRIWYGYSGGRRAFYHQLIPSFQGEWGFVIWAKSSVGPFSHVMLSQGPEGDEFRVLSTQQLYEWAHLTKLWTLALPVAYLV